MTKKKCGGEELWIIDVKEDVTLLKKDWSKQIGKQIVGKQITILIRRVNWLNIYLIELLPYVR